LVGDTLGGTNEPRKLFGVVEKAPLGEGTTFTGGKKCPSNRGGGGGPVVHPSVGNKHSRAAKKLRKASSPGLPREKFAPLFFMTLKRRNR